MPQAASTNVSPPTLHAGARLLLIFLGGAAGAVLRTLILTPSLEVPPLREASLLFAVNVAGAFLLGVLLGALTVPSGRTAPTGTGTPSVKHRLQPRIADVAKSLLGTGLLGGFTSYSSLVLLAAPASGAWPSGLILAAATFILGIIAAFFGVALGRRFRITPPAAPSASGAAR